MEARLALLIVVIFITILLGAAALILIMHVSSDSNPEHKRVAWCLTVVFVGSLLLTVVLGVGYRTFANINTRYIEAQNCEDRGDMYDAYLIYLEIYSEMGAWQDVKDCIRRVEIPAKYEYATTLQELGKYYEAVTAFTEISDFADAKAKAEECMRLHLATIN